MIKLLRSYTIFGKQDRHCPCIEAKYQQMQADYANYFATISAGTVLNWAQGTLIMGDSKVAVYTGPDGIKLTMTRDTSIKSIYQKNQYIRQAWDEAYGKGVPFQTTHYDFLILKGE
jgi:hypothetical protein